jgi:hypothetical protein
MYKRRHYRVWRTAIFVSLYRHLPLDAIKLIYAKSSDDVVQSLIPKSISALASAMPDANTFGLLGCVFLKHNGLKLDVLFSFAWNPMHKLQYVRAQVSCTHCNDCEFNRDTYVTKQLRLRQRGCGHRSETMF